MNCSVSFFNVERHSLEKGLDVSFSHVTYNVIALLVSLDPVYKGEDAPNFLVARARVPKSFSKLVVQDVERTMKQYGKLIQHGSEEAHSRFLAPVCSIVHRCVFDI
jgi:hypothetical protein